MLPIAFATGAWIFLAFVVVMFFAIVLHYYTRRGSGINQHPIDSRGGSPGASGSSRISSAEQPGDRGDPGDVRA